MATKTKEKKRRDPLPLAAIIPPGCEALLSKKQIVAALGLSLRTLESMLAADEFPPPDIRLQRFPRWRIGTLNAWIESQAAKTRGA